MEIKVKELVNNMEIVNRARTTVWKDGLEKEPSTKFLDNIYTSEHSPIRVKTFLIEIKGIKSWIATHLVRHNIGYEPFVSTQRDDRVDNPIERDFKPQGALVNIDIVLNAQSVINVSKVRLCSKASKETREVWEKVVAEISAIAPELGAKCVPTCIYRGFCPEEGPCGNVKTEKFKQWRKEYIGDRPSIG